MNFIILVKHKDDKQSLVYGDDNPVMQIPVGMSMQEFANQNFQGMGELFVEELASIRQVGYTTMVTLDVNDSTCSVLFEMLMNELRAEIGTPQWQSQFKEINHEPLETHPEVAALIRDLFSNVN